MFTLFLAIPLVNYEQTFNLEQLGLLWEVLMDKMKRWRPYPLKEHLDPV